MAILRTLCFCKGVDSRTPSCFYGESLNEMGGRGDIVPALHSRLQRRALERCHVDAPECVPNLKAADANTHSPWSTWLLVTTTARAWAACSRFESSFLNLHGFMLEDCKMLSSDRCFTGRLAFDGKLRSSHNLPTGVSSVTCTPEVFWNGVIPAHGRTRRRD